jgi:hypothetical protein
MKISCLIRISCGSLGGSALIGISCGLGLLGRWAINNLVRVNISSEQYDHKIALDIRTYRGC